MTEPIRDPEMDGEQLTPNQLREKAISDARLAEIEAHNQLKKDYQKKMVEPVVDLIARWKREIAEKAEARNARPFFEDISTPTTGDTGLH